MARKLLVADDSLTIQKVIKLALSNDGYEIQTVSSGNDAIQQISLFQPDAVLIDVSLPGKNAFEVKAAINAQGDFAQMKFVLMSSAFEKVDEDRARSVQFQGRLTKPFDPAHLRQVLATVLESAPSSLPSLGASDSLWDTDTERFSGLTPPPLPGTRPPLPPMVFTDSPLQSSNDDDSHSDIRNLTESTVRMSGLDDFQWNISETSKKFHLDPPAQDLVGHVELEDHDEAEGQVGGHFDGHLDGMMDLPPSGGSGKETPEAFAQKSLEKTLEETLERMAQKLLPELAERILKQEIRKLLQDPV